MAFDQFYSIFDKIACLINNYFHLNIKGRAIAFSSLYKNNIVRLFSKHPNDVWASRSNLALRGLYWMNKDIYHKNKESGLDNKLNISYKIRNAMTHRGLFILNDSLNGRFYNKTENDNLYYVSWTEFYINTIHLAHVVREAIILLTITINSTMILDTPIIYYPDRKCDFLFK